MTISRTEFGLLHEPKNGTESLEKSEDRQAQNSKYYQLHNPEELHKSVWHNVFTGENMDEINGKVLAWVGSQQEWSEIEWKYQ